MTNFWQSCRMFLWMTVCLGLLYPLLIALIGYFAMHEQSTGSIILHNGKAVGSQLIAQKFTADKYFWPRPSSVDYNPLPSGASNLGPISAELKKKVAERTQMLSKDQKGIALGKIPSDLLFASGSGLDPHITPAAATFQISRIAKARHLDPKVLQQLIIKQTKKRPFGFLGEDCVNVLMLNIALDELK